MADTKTVKGYRADTWEYVEKTANLITIPQNDPAIPEDIILEDVKTFNEIPVEAKTVIVNGYISHYEKVYNGQTYRLVVLYRPVFNKYSSIPSGFTISDFMLEVI